MSALFRLFVIVSTGSLLGAFVVTGAPAVARAARVRGAIDAVARPTAALRTGFTRKLIVPNPESAPRRKPDVALFLAVKDGESFPIPAPTKHQRVTVVGLEFSPSIASCASDAQVTFYNAERESLSLTVDGEDFGDVAPGATKTYVCSPGQPLRIIRVKQFPHMQAVVYVGEVGVAAVPDDRGKFSFEAPKGKYELRVLGRDGIVLKNEVTVDDSDLNLGRLDVGAAGAEPPSE